MDSNLQLWSTLAIALFLSAALSGCAGGGDGNASPSPTGPGATTTPGGTGGNITPPKPNPGEAYRQSVTFTPSAAPTAPTKMTITTNWTTLSVSVFFNSTAAIWYLTGDTPNTAASVTIESPSKVKTSLTASTSNVGSCAPNTACIIGQEQKKDVPNEMGDWTITAMGRGQNAKADIVVKGK